MTRRSKASRDAQRERAADAEAFVDGYKAGKLGRPRECPYLPELETLTASWLQGFDLGVQQLAGAMKPTSEQLKWLRQAALSDARQR